MSPPQQPILPSLDSVDQRAQAAIVVLLNAMGLNGINQSTYQQMSPDQRSINLPCILVTKEGQAEEELDTSDVTTEDFSLPYNLFLVDRQSPTDHTRLPVYQGWRQAVAHNFRTRTFIGTATTNPVPEVWNVLVKLMQAIDPAYMKQAEGFWLVSGLVLTCWASLPRQLETVVPYSTPPVSFGS